MFRCVQAFRALCLIRLSRADEAEPLLQQLCSDDGEMKDENTLQLLQFCFREIHRGTFVVVATSGVVPFVLPLLFLIVQRL